MEEIHFLLIKVLKCKPNILCCSPEYMKTLSIIHFNENGEVVTGASTHQLWTYKFTKNRQPFILQVMVFSFTKILTYSFLLTLNYTIVVLCSLGIFNFLI